MNEKYIEKKLISIIKKQLGLTAKQIRPIAGGVNSELYYIATQKNEELLAKHYLTFPDNSRDRLSSEFTALSFLWSLRFREIAEPLCESKVDNVGVYRYLHGKKLTKTTLQKNHVAQLADFLNKLHSLCRRKEAKHLPMASEACTSIEQYFEVIWQRLDCLIKVKQKGNDLSALKKFLNIEFIPEFSAIQKQIKAKMNQLGIKISQNLQKAELTLSPSDIGFHNCLVDSQEKLLFFDFEYFGWDDPAKMISDCLNQPRIAIPAAWRPHFLRQVYNNLGDNNRLKKRLPAVYTLSALNWSLIMLNVFLRSSDAQRRLVRLKQARMKFLQTILEWRNNSYPKGLL